MAEEVRQVPIQDTGGGGATTAAPGAGSQFVGVTPSQAGLYRVEVLIALTGTAETALANARLKSLGATLISGLPTLSGQVIRLTFDRVNCDGTNPIQLVAQSAATAGSVYNGTILYSRIQ